MWGGHGLRVSDGVCDVNGGLLKVGSCCCWLEKGTDMRGRCSV